MTKISIENALKKTKFSIEKLRQQKGFDVKCCVIKKKVILMY